MRTITWTDTSKAGDVERDGIVWAAGPRARTAWVAMAEVIEAGFAPRTDEMVLIDTRTMRKVHADVRQQYADLAVAGHQGIADTTYMMRRLELRYAPRMAKREWDALTGGVDAYRVDDEQMTLAA